MSYISQAVDALHDVGVLVRLHVSCFEAQAMQLSWSWPSAEDRTDVGSVLRALALPLQAHGQEHNVELSLVVRAGAQRVMLEHNCVDLRCSLNGRMLQAGERVELRHADVLDVGLCRLEVDMPQAALQAYEDVDLRDLAHGFDGHWQEALMLQKADRLDDLLQSSWEPKGQSASDEASGGVSLTDTPWHEHLQAQITDATDLSGEKGLEYWHERYLRHLQAPNDQQTLGEWVGPSSVKAVGHTDAYEQLLTQALEGPELATLLGQEEHINAVLAQLGTHDELALLAPDQTDNVMHLFAPDNWKPNDVHQTMPSLTRQEHHMVSLDSVLFSSESPSNKRK